MILCTSVVGGLKQMADMDRPRDVAAFGGDRPYALELMNRPQGHCYPGAHASSGFALMTLYFALRDRRPRQVRDSLAVTIAMSAGLAWLLQLALWHKLLESPAPDAPRWVPASARV